MKDAPQEQRPITREEFLKLGGAAALASISDQVARQVVSSNAAQAAVGARAEHGAPLRGLEIVVKKGRNAEGRFGLMFKNLPAFEPPDDLLASLAKKLTDPALSSGDNPRLSGGFTFLGQFLDHDMTLDTTPLTEQSQDPLATTNFRSPLLDLDSVYGKGPQGSPELYAGNRLKTVTNQHGVEDVPRDASGKAIIGDSRNDENLLVSQLHLAFIKFANAALDAVGGNFTQAQQQARWHYHWMISRQFLHAVCGEETVARILSPDNKVTTRFYMPADPSRPMMPIEFAVAAYRFGHSMIRTGYTKSV